jgi:hypothetical protein
MIFADRSPEEILNRVAQGRLGPDDVLPWFSQLPPESQARVNRRLAYFALQAGVVESDVMPAVNAAGLSPRYTPCVLLKKGTLKTQLPKVLSLPPNESSKTFRLLCQVFRIADERRRVTRCTPNCGHWWHNLDTHEVR